MNSKQRFEYIDALRGIAIILVIITHAASLTQLKGILRTYTTLGSMGVQLFFVISAFTIFYTLSKSAGGKNQFRDFFIKRLFRIVPVYWLGIFLYTLVYGLGSRGWLIGPELWHYPLHFLLLNNLHPAASSSVVPGGWSISCEVLFYLFVPLIYCRIFHTNRRFVMFLLFAGIFLPITNYLLKQNFQTALLQHYDIETVNAFFYRWIPNQLICFALGMVLYKIWKDGRYKKLLINKALNLFLLIICILLFFILRYPFRTFQPHIVYSIIFVVLALLLSIYPWKILVNKASIFMGRISFSGYLVHFLVLKQVDVLLTTVYPDLAKHNILYFVIVTILGFGLVIPLAYLSYKLIEENAVKMGRILIERLNFRASISKKNHF